MRRLFYGESYRSFSGPLHLAAFSIILLALLPTLVMAQWAQLNGDIDGEAFLDQSGWAVALSDDGDRVAIGAPTNDGNGSGSGHVRVYDWNGTSWVQAGADIDGEAADDNSGNSIALSSDGLRLAVGAKANDGNGSFSGHVRVFGWNGSNWTQVGADIDGEVAGDSSGESVALSADGSRVAVGAILNDGSAMNAGQVRVFDWNGSVWVQVGSDIDGEGANDQSGTSVALSANGNRLAIGAPLNSDNGDFSGHVRVYDWNGSAWVQLGSDIDGEAAGDTSGGSVTLSADGIRLAVGATRNADNGDFSGHVRVFEWTGSAWVQLGADIDGEAPSDQSGSSVALSNDGARLAVGALANDGNGLDSGHVRVFEWDGSTTSWVQVGADIDGEATGDASGRSIALSADGIRLAVGANGNDGNGSFSGHVRVFATSIDTDPVILRDGFEG